MMTTQELDQRLRGLNEVELAYRGTTPDGLRIYFSNENPTDAWIINSDKLMEEGEVIAIHKHDRFVTFDKHRHDYLEMIFVYSGAIRQSIEGKDLTINKGEIFLLDMNMEHSIYEAGEDDIAINILIKKNSSILFHETGGI